MTLENIQVFERDILPKYLEHGEQNVLDTESDQVPGYDNTDDRKISRPNGLAESHSEMDVEALPIDTDKMGLRGRLPSNGEVKVQVTQDMVTGPGYDDAAGLLNDADRNNVIPDIFSTYKLNDEVSITNKDQDDMTNKDQDDIANNDPEHIENNNLLMEGIFSEGEDLTNPFTDYKDDERCNEITESATANDPDHTQFSTEMYFSEGEDLTNPFMDYQDDKGSLEVADSATANDPDHKHFSTEMGNEPQLHDSAVPLTIEPSNSNDINSWQHINADVDDPKEDDYYILPEDENPMYGDSIYDKYVTSSEEDRQRFLQFLVSERQIDFNLIQSQEEENSQDSDDLVSIEDNSYSDEEESATDSIEVSENEVEPEISPADDHKDYIEQLISKMKYDQASETKTYEGLQISTGAYINMLNDYINETGEGTPNENAESFINGLLTDDVAFSIKDDFQRVNGIDNLIISKDIDSINYFSSNYCVKHDPEMAINCDYRSVCQYSNNIPIPREFRIPGQKAYYFNHLKNMRFLTSGRYHVHIAFPKINSKNTYGWNPFMNEDDIRGFYDTFYSVLDDVLIEEAAGVATAQNFTKSYSMDKILTKSVSQTRHKMYSQKPISASLLHRVFEQLRVAYDNHPLFDKFFFLTTVINIKDLDSWQTFKLIDHFNVNEAGMINQDNLFVDYAITFRQAQDSVPSMLFMNSYSIDQMFSLFDANSNSEKHNYNHFDCLKGFILYPKTEIMQKSGIIKIKNYVQELHTNFQQQDGMFHEKFSIKRLISDTAEETKSHASKSTLATDEREMKELCRSTRQNCTNRLEFTGNYSSYLIMKNNYKNFVKKLSFTKVPTAEFMKLVELKGTYMLMNNRLANDSVLLKELEKKLFNVYTHYMLNSLVSKITENSSTRSFLGSEKTKTSNIFSLNIFESIRKRNQAFISQEIFTGNLGIFYKESLFDKSSRGKAIPHFSENYRFNIPELAERVWQAFRERCGNVPTQFRKEHKQGYFNFDRKSIVRVVQKNRFKITNVSSLKCLKDYKKPNLSLWMSYFNYIFTPEIKDVDEDDEILSDVSDVETAKDGKRKRTIFKSVYYKMLTEIKKIVPQQMYDELIELLRRKFNNVEIVPHITHTIFWNVKYNPRGNQVSFISKSAVVRFQKQANTNLPKFRKNGPTYRKTDYDEFFNNIKEDFNIGQRIPPSEYTPVPDLVEIVIPKIKQEVSKSDESLDKGLDSESLVQSNQDQIDEYHEDDHIENQNEDHKEYQNEDHKEYQNDDHKEYQNEDLKDDHNEDNKEYQNDDLKDDQRHDEKVDDHNEDNKDNQNEDLKDDQRHDEKVDDHIILIQEEVKSQNVGSRKRRKKSSSNFTAKRRKKNVVLAGASDPIQRTQMIAVIPEKWLNKSDIACVSIQDTHFYNACNFDISSEDYSLNQNVGRPLIGWHHNSCSIDNFLEMLISSIHNSPYKTNIQNALQKSEMGICILNFYDTRVNNPYEPEHHVQSRDQLRAEISLLIKDKGLDPESAGSDAFFSMKEKMNNSWFYRLLCYLEKENLSILKKFMFFGTKNECSCKQRISPIEFDAAYECDNNVSFLENFRRMFLLKAYSDGFYHCRVCKTKTSKIPKSIGYLSFPEIFNFQIKIRRKEDPPKVLVFRGPSNVTFKYALIGHEVCTGNHYMSHIRPYYDFSSYVYYDDTDNANKPFSRGIHKQYASFTHDYDSEIITLTFMLIESSEIEVEPITSNHRDPSVSSYDAYESEEEPLQILHPEEPTKTYPKEEASIPTTTAIQIDEKWKKLNDILNQSKGITFFCGAGVASQNKQTCFCL